MMLQSFLFLLGTATLALGVPTAPTTTPVNSPPIPVASAKAIFEHGNLHLHSDVVPNIVPVRPTNQPLQPHPSKIANPTVSYVKLPQAATPVVNTPGVPESGNILVGIDQSISLATFDHGNLAINSTITKRQSCPYPNCCPDPRYLAESTAFPYSVTGRWANPDWSCSGTLVGPRHVLTASHCIDWNGANSWTGTLTFQPDYWPGHNLGTYTSSLLIRYDETPENGVGNDCAIAFDYVVAVLDEYPNLGWLGSKTYDTRWNDLKVWYETGYATNPGGSQYPYAQGPFEVVAELPECYGGDILEYTACGTPGDSGSSVFSWWPDGPYLIGLVAWQGYLPSGSSDRNLWGPGGANLPNLISIARADHP